MRAIRKLSYSLLGCLCLHAVPSFAADDCPGGSPSTAECARQLAALERQLASAYIQAEKRLTGKIGSAGYGGTEGTEYLQQAIESFRVSNKAWRQYRDKECWYLALRDGMSLSPDYASPVSEACKVERTRERIKSLKR